MGFVWSTYLLPIYKQIGLLNKMLPGREVSDVDIDTLADEVWIVGSPDTVAEKLAASAERAGGWGTTLVYGHDYGDDPKPYFNSMELLTKEVAPRLAGA
jgi:alkanesulfonate monooxygenase SsuD/methylene tetrahydromethanopterin reductase-like flavin-dependent oxidoreductase (luciferase family)